MNNKMTNQTDMSPPLESSSLSVHATLRGLKKEAVFVYAGYFLRYLSLLILIPYYGHVLGPVSYGKVLAAMSLMNIIWMTVNYGFSTIGARAIAMASSRLEYSQILGRQIKARCLLIPVGILLGIIGTIVSPSLNQTPSLGVFATLQGILASFNLGWFFQGIRKFRTLVALEALSYPINLFFILLFVHKPSDEMYALMALCFSSMICLAVAYSIARKDVDYSLKLLLYGFKEIQQSSVIFLLSISSMIMTSGSTYLLSLLSTTTEVGYFGAAERFIAFGLGILNPMSQLLMPTITKLRGSNPASALRLARKGLCLEFCFGIFVLIIGITLSPFVIPFVMGTKFFSSVTTLQIMLCIFPFVAISHALGSYLFVPIGKEKFIAIATIIGTIVNVVCAIVFVSRYGSSGMAIARVLSEITIAAFLIFFAVRSGIFYSKVINNT
jgi:O-antigen/teichoic acid export membrane protein